MRVTELISTLSKNCNPWFQVGVGSAPPEYAIFGERLSGYKMGNNQ